VSVLSPRVGMDAPAANLPVQQGVSASPDQVGASSSRCTILHRGVAGAHGRLRPLDVAPVARCQITRIHQRKQGRSSAGCCRTPDVPGAPPSSAMRRSGPGPRILALAGTAAVPPGVGPWRRRPPEETAGCGVDRRRGGTILTWLTLLAVSGCASAAPALSPSPRSAAARRRQPDTDRRARNRDAGPRPPPPPRPPAGAMTLWWSSPTRGWAPSTRRSPAPATPSTW
jgi:hypothetical protein